MGFVSFAPHILNCLLCLLRFEAVRCWADASAFICFVTCYHFFDIVLNHCFIIAQPHPFQMYHLCIMFQSCQFQMYHVCIIFQGPWFQMHDFCWYFALSWIVLFSWLLSISLNLIVSSFWPWTGRNSKTKKNHTVNHCRVHRQRESYFWGNLFFRMILPMIVRAPPNFKMILKWYLQLCQQTGLSQNDKPQRLQNDWKMVNYVFWGSTVSSSVRFL